MQTMSRALVRNENAINGSASKTELYLVGGHSTTS